MTQIQFFCVPFNPKTPRLVRATGIVLLTKKKTLSPHLQFFSIRLSKGNFNNIFIDLREIK